MNHEGSDCNEQNKNLDRVRMNLLQLLAQSEYTGSCLVKNGKIVLGILIREWSENGNPVFFSEHICT